MVTQIVVWQVSFNGIRVGEASHPGPASLLRIAFGNVSSMILHQDYINTLPCDVFGLCETRLNETGIRLIHESLKDLNWTFVPGKAQPQRRAGVEGRFLDAMPGGVGVMAKSHIPIVRTPLLLDTYTEEESRRVVSVTILPGGGLEPVRIYQIYGFARAKDDPDRMALNEQLLRKVFQEANSGELVPTLIIGDFNIDPIYSAEVTNEVGRGNWVDAATIRASIEGTSPPWTFAQGNVTSRIDVCLLNTGAMHMFTNFEQWNHEGCTIPNHKVQCLILKIGGGKQFAMKPKKVQAIPGFVPFHGADAEFINDSVIEEFGDKLNKCFDDNDVEDYWNTWCRMAEKWLLLHSALANGSDDALVSDKYKGRGRFKLVLSEVNKMHKEVSDQGDAVDPKLSSALKIRRVLEEIERKQLLPQSVELNRELQNLWAKAGRVAKADCKVTQTEYLRNTVRLPERNVIERICDSIRKFINNRGAQLRKIRLHKVQQG